LGVLEICYFGKVLLLHLSARILEFTHRREERGRYTKDEITAVISEAMRVNQVQADAEIQTGRGRQRDGSILCPV